MVFEETFLTNYAFDIFQTYNILIHHFWVSRKAASLNVALDVYMIANILWEQ